MKKVIILILILIVLVGAVWFAFFNEDESVLETNS